MHFFGSKAKLLTASVEWPFDPDEALGRVRTGEDLARLFVGNWDKLGDANPIITLLRAATTEPAAASLLREFLHQRLTGPLVARLGSDQPGLRADLVASQLIGLGITRYILGFEPLAAAPAEQVIACVGPVLERYLTGEMPAAEPVD